MSAPASPTGRTVGAPIPVLMSPAQAAHHTQVSRRTIMRAIERKELRAYRDNRNCWQIQRTELEEWAGTYATPIRQRSSPTQFETALQLAAAKATISQLEARLHAAEQERDHWRNMAERLSERHPQVSPPRRFWPWRRM